MVQNSRHSFSLDIFEIKIKYLAKENKIDSLIDIEDSRIAKICIEALKNEIAKKQEDEAGTREPYRETKIKVRQWLIDKKIKETKENR